ncbi:MAG: HAMP domain-containing histidine kinase [Phycisphaerales bacterium]|nr:HAMP domain-containing histidine kinase [Phycisphaerales bacterium]MCB9836810.1 HAMP domain-containing histidine kinase [Phycisphaera sp.]
MATDSDSRAHAGGESPACLGLLGAMRIRKKLIILHTTFSIVLGAVLLVTLRPGASAVIARAESSQALAVLSILDREGWFAGGGDLPSQLEDDQNLTIRVGSADELGLSAKARAAEEYPGIARADANGSSAVMPLAVSDRAEPRYAMVTSRIPDARSAVLQLYGFTVVAILAMYGLIAAILELFVLPQNVYSPISRLLEADQAVQDGDATAELIDEQHIPADELGAIMRSRNETVRSLRQHEHDLADALGRFEIVAADLKRKNHLLESAKRNLADADRLASLGMLSAGIAHELNTPLTVVKGLVEKLDASGGTGLSEAEARLLVRVVGRLERLGESLLDFARVRPPETRPTKPASVIEEAMTLVRLDREAKSVELTSSVSDQLVIACDADRMVQVFVNLIRNAVDAVTRGDGIRQVEVSAALFERDGSEWVSIKVSDTGPGIDSSLIESLFEPFVSTRLDAKGTGLGLAVAEGIVREHGGVILAHNRSDGPGAVFEVVVPVVPPGDGSAPGGESRTPGRLESPMRPSEGESHV